MYSCRRPLRKCHCDWVLCFLHVAPWGCAHVQSACFILGQWTKTAGKKRQGKEWSRIWATLLQKKQSGLTFKLHYHNKGRRRLVWTVIKWLPHLWYHRSVIFVETLKLKPLSLQFHIKHTALKGWNRTRHFLFFFWLWMLQFIDFCEMYYFGRLLCSTYPS